MSHSHLSRLSFSVRGAKCSPSDCMRPGLNLFLQVGDPWGKLPLLSQTALPWGRAVFPCLILGLQDDRVLSLPRTRAPLSVHFSADPFVIK